MTCDITIKDVAKQANVSVATVSRVLNGLDRVSDQTRKKVLKVVKELNYVPNTMAASMITKQTQMLAVVVPEIENPFYTSVIKGTVNVAKERGYNTFVFSTNDSESEEDTFFESSLRRNVDGIVLIGAHKDPVFYQKMNKPVILVDRYIDGCGLDGVIIDNFGGAYEATKYLIEYGHRDIAIITGPQTFNDGTERYWGYQQALKDNGIELVSDYQKHGDWFENNGYQSTKELMKLPKPPTAIFAANNLICQGTIKALRDLDLTIGLDVSLVGFDANDLAEFVKPRVSVVKRPTYEMGTHAAEMLIEKLKQVEKNESFPKKVTLGVELQKFGSVKYLG
ncbi:MULTISPECIES: LacI family DNA-binding transcriptional regulator [Bacillaceae]|uniref:LacI family transcriptional regulator n=1 Tax=Peribacillus huizhouensis TaxID=1501239 RepID=A0ABR6CMY1_9BACI|nr:MULTISPECIES: LacI family DNA-binding transcriptional regulator [Bacillaceae]MBA9026359.1 LacI family transcriptional regulator [Peribacillus huizhouensis]